MTFFMNKPLSSRLATTCKTIFREEKKSKFNKTFLHLFHVPSLLVDSGHYRHLIHVQISKKRIIPLTHGRYEVSKIVHWDQTNNLV